VANTTKTSVANSLPDTFIAEVRLKTQEGPVMRALVNNVTLPTGEGGQWEMTELTRATAVALADGFDMVGTDTITDTTLQITPTEFGAQLTITDLAKNQITKRTDLIRQAGRILGNSMTTKEDIDLLTMLDGFSVALGSAGTALTPGHIMAAAAAVRGGGQVAGAIVAGTPEPAPDPMYAVFNDAQLHSVTKFLVGGATGGTLAATSIAAPSAGAGEAALAEARVGRIGRTTVYCDNNLSKDSADDAKGGVFSKEAIVQVHFMGGPSMEEQRDASLRGTEYNIVMVKGTGEYKDQWGREMLFDAAAPTS
jgi:hypothetical protein